MENFDNLSHVDANTIHDLILIASNERLFSILDKRLQERLLKLVYRYTKESLNAIERQCELDTMSDEEFYDNCARK